MTRSYVWGLVTGIVIGALITGATQILVTLALVSTS